jgi:uncharacterized protein YcnI
MSPLALSRGRRLTIAAGLSVAGTLFLPPAAFAHISISPDTAVPGEQATVSFHVPNERDDASTVRLEVHFPADRPVASASPQTLPGWNVTVHKQKLDTPVNTEHGSVSEAVTSIVWEGGQIPPDTFQEFPVSLGPFPHGPGSLVFKSLQTYSDGEVVRWIDTQEAGQPEPEYPAPSLSVAPPPAIPESTSDTSARLLGGAGLVAGLAALVWSALRGRKAVQETPVEPKLGKKREKARL